MLEHELKVVRQLVLEVGEAILRIAEKHYHTAPENVDRTVVTEADLEADRLLRERLGEEFPSYGWLSEETKMDARRHTSSRVWIVDPIDGTREFVLQIPEYAVSVSLVEDGVPVLGVVYNPPKQELYSAIKGQGAQLNGSLIRCDHDLGGKPIVEVSRSDIDKGRFSAFEDNVQLHPCGSIAYKLARLAAGRVDSTLSLTPKNEWDIAAGVILVTEAGGRITELKGGGYCFNQKDTLVNGVIAATQEAYRPIKEMVDFWQSERPRPEAAIF
ncbi:3'(2'),5'-bisphosphate nucleotidase CysQ [Planctomycetota bacterium]